MNTTHRNILLFFVLVFNLVLISIHYTILYGNAQRLPNNRRSPRSMSSIVLRLFGTTSIHTTRIELDLRKHATLWLTTLFILEHEVFLIPKAARHSSLTLPLSRIRVGSLYEHEAFQHVWWELACHLCELQDATWEASCKVGVGFEERLEKMSRLDICHHTLEHVESPGVAL